MMKNETKFDYIFNYETTTRNDYRYGEINPLTKTKFKAKGRCYRIRPGALKDTHTLSDLSKPLSINLFVKPKAILWEDPQAVQTPFTKLEDTGKAEAIRTRPRQVMTPAISLDDIRDEKQRQLLISDTYTTSLSRSNMHIEEYTRARKDVRSPFPGQPAPSNPFVLRKVQPSYVSPEWRMESVKWDGEGMRAYCDPTLRFWLDRPRHW